MIFRLLCLLVPVCFVLCGCSGDGAADTQPVASTQPPSGNASPAASAQTDPPVDSDVVAQPATIGNDPASVGAQSARELSLSWVGDVAAVVADPLDRKQVSVRGDVIRVTPTRWFNLQFLNKPEAAVWLRGDAANLSDGREIWIKCEFDDVAVVEELRSGQSVAIAGRYQRSPVKGNILIDRCRLLAKGSVPAGEAKSPPVFPLAELQEIGRKVQAFEDTNQLPMKLATTSHGLLQLHLDKELFSGKRVFPQRALNAVESLPIGSVECSGEGASQFLAVANRFPRLRDVVFKGKLNCSPDDFLQLNKVSHLESLELRYCDSIDDALAAGIARLTSLRSLVLERGFESYALTNAGVASLASLKNLRRLQFDSNDQISDESFSRIAALPRLRHLAVRFPSFSANPVLGNAAVAALSSGALPELKYLDLNGQLNVTDAAIESLIRQKRNFAALDLGGTGVSDAGLTRILEANLADRIVKLPEEAGDNIRFQLVEAGMMRED